MERFEQILFRRGHKEAKPADGFAPLPGVSGVTLLLSLA